MSSEQNLLEKPVWTNFVGRKLGLVMAAPVVAQLLGSAFNIWYNFTYVQPLLSAAELAVFWQTVKLFNAVVYPMGVGVWVWAVLSLRQTCQQLEQQQPVPSDQLLQARRRVINLPWWVVAIAATVWLLCIPVFLIALMQAPGELNPRILFDLPVSFLIAALIATTHSFFLVELATQHLLYPLLFQEVRPFQISGTVPLSLRWRGLLFSLCGGVCPIVSLLLLSVAPHECDRQDPWFAIAVGSLGILFSLTSAWMVEQLVVEPIKAIQRTTAAVTRGNLAIRLGLLRADEFGPLIAEFNQMIAELQENQYLQETFGRHVGEQAALRIMRRDPGLSGIEQEITVLFADLRNFTQRCTTLEPQQVVALLNLFLTEMVDIVERRHGGMVNKFLGDGFMAIFGVGDSSENHATQAVAAAQEMLQSLETINRRLELEGKQPLKMGIGIHTGTAVVGSIGSDRRMEYTAIGDTVNIASRVEALTKVVGEPLLLTAATQQTLPANTIIQQLPPQWVKGKTEPIEIYCVKDI
jgi:adenylate cyclase